MSETVGYLTKRFPRLSETFILDEILGLEQAGVPLRLYALAHPGEGLVQPDVLRVSSPVVYLHSPGRLLDRAASVLSTVCAHARLLLRAPRRYLSVVVYIARKRRHLSTVRHFVEAGRLAVLLEEAEARHLHAAFAHGPASVAHFVHLLTGLPFSFAAHAKDLYLSAPDLLARKVAASTVVLTCSESAATALREIAGPSAGKVVMARHGVDAARFREAELTRRRSTDELRVLAVGRLVEKKGYPVLLDALATLARQGRRVSCTIIGSGPCRPEIESAVSRLGLSSVVSLLGARTHQDVAEAHRLCDVFVQASVVLANGDRDGTPNSLLEAMASGVCVVASDVAGIPEVVVPGCGVLVAPGDSAALAGALARIADDPGLGRRLGAAARSHVTEHLDRTVCARELARYFEAPVSAQVERVLAGGKR